MEFAEVVRRRRMVRDYDPSRPVPAEVRERLLGHAIRAPSAGFSQGWAFLVLETPEERERFWTATTDGGTPDRWLTRMRRAPLLIVPLSNKSAYLDRYAEPDKHRPPRDTADPDGPDPDGPQRAGPNPDRRPHHAAGAEPSDHAAGRWSVPYWFVDAGMASLLILQTAVDEGLGACFFGVPGDRVPVLRAEFGVPDEYAPVGAITVGHRAPGEHRGGSAVSRPRRPVEEVVHRGRWASDG